MRTQKMGLEYRTEHENFFDSRTQNRTDLENNFDPRTQNRTQKKKILELEQN